MKEDEYTIKAGLLHPSWERPKMLVFTREQLLSNIIVSDEAGRDDYKLTFKYLLKLFDEN